MIIRPEPDDDLSPYTDEADPHLWRTASMARWHLAVARPPAGIGARCGGGIEGVPDPASFHWRDGILVPLRAIKSSGVTWPNACSRCLPLIPEDLRP